MGTKISLWNYSCVEKCKRFLKLVESMLERTYIAIAIIAVMAAVYLIMAIVYRRKKRLKRMYKRYDRLSD